uniref:uncharacterized protein LOC122607825 n=1 Tax=Erigeron canadensis TaxID=72917 RepID=UPI001CB98E81|nr:uncharacterized protein LOC122607825 [Erigeron canadensis]
MSHNTTTTHRRNYAPPPPETTTMNHNHPNPTTTHHPDPPPITSIQNISNHFSRLYMNHKKAHSSSSSSIIDNSTTSSASSLTKSLSQSQTTTRLSKKKPKPLHYYYSNKPNEQHQEEDKIKRAIVVSNKIPTTKKPQEMIEDDVEVKKYVNLKLIKDEQQQNGFDIKKQNMSMGMMRRKSFGSSSKAELNDFFACNGVKVVSADMPPYMQIHVVDVTRKTYDSLEKFTAKTLALTLKKEFDGIYGPAWHCIVGSSFGSFVTHSVGGFMYFSMDQKLYVLLFKTAVQRAH